MTKVLRRLAAPVSTVVAVLAVIVAGPAVGHGAAPPAGPVHPAASGTPTPSQPPGCDGCVSAQDAICWEGKAPVLCPIPVGTTSPVPTQLTIHFRTEPGSARPPADYTDVPYGTVVIPAGGTVGYAMIPLPAGAGGGQVRTFSVVFFDPSYGRLVRDRAIVTLSPSGQ